MTWPARTGPALVTSIDARRPPLIPGQSPALGRDRSRNRVNTDERPAMPQRLTRHTLKDQAKEFLRDFISESRFSTGRRINVGQLAAHLGVSRTPVCQALEELKEEGLVEYSANRGYFMLEMTPDKALDLYMVRGVLEGLACRLAAHNASPQEIARIREAAEEQRSLVESEDVLNYSRTTFDFHALVSNASGNSVLAEVLDLLKDRARPLNVDITPILGDLHQDHLDLVDALVQRDAEMAGVIATGHCVRMQKLIISTAGLDRQIVNQLKSKAVGQGVDLMLLNMALAQAPDETGRRGRRPAG
jgi:DNA-binding GntR family transcriptional regulator